MLRPENYFDFMEVGWLSRVHGFGRDAHVVLLVLLDVPLLLTPTGALLQELLGKLLGLFAFAQVGADVVLHLERRLHILTKHK